MEKKSMLQRVHEKGLWIGPVARLKDKLKRAYQLLNNRSFNGVFESGTFDAYPEFDQGNNTMYLGKPTDLFRPVIGRDDIRDENGKLRKIKCEEEIEELCKKKARKKNNGQLVAVEPSSHELMVYELDHSRQMGLIEPSTFEGYEVQICGMNGVGVEIGIQLMKMGLPKLEIFDPYEVEESELAITSFRCIDPHRSRAQASFEIIADGTRKPIDYFLTAVPEEFGQIVVNTFSNLELRRAVWRAVQGSSGVSFYMDVQVSGYVGTLMLINPSDSKSVELYESQLIEVDDFPQIISAVKTVSGYAGLAVQRYVGTPGNERNSCIDRMYVIDTNAFFREAGVWGKMNAR